MSMALPAEEEAFRQLVFPTELCRALFAVHHLAHYRQLELTAVDSSGHLLLLS